jgi:preprotein translocase subunit SecG
MIIFVTIVHILVSLFLCTVVLMQHGKSADIAATFGGQGSQTAFGPRGAATLLSKATTWSAVIFMLTSFSLTVMLRNRGGEGGSVMQGEKPAQTLPAKPSATPTPQPQQQQPAEQHPPSR